MDYFRQNKTGLLIVGIVGVLVFCITVATLLIANTQSPTSSTSQSDFSIQLTRGVCFGFCPAYTLEINGNGKAEFTGQNYTAVDGQTLEYSVDKSEVNKLIARVTEIDFFSLKDRYEDPYITDLPSMEIKVTSNGKSKSIYVYGMVGKDYPRELNELAELIDIIGRTKDYTGQANDLPLELPEEVDYTR